MTDLALTDSNMRPLTDEEAKLHGIWTRSAARAEAQGATPLAVRTSLFAAGLVLLRATMGDAALAQYLGQLAVAAHRAAGGELDDEGAALSPHAAPRPRAN